MTTHERIELTTSADLRAGLRLLGIRWSVRAEDQNSRTGDLYSWVFGSERDIRPSDTMQRGVLYVGVHRGTRGRTAYEESVRGGWHGHGLAIKRATATVVTGAVTDLGPSAVETELGAGAKPGFAHEVQCGLERLDRDRAAGRVLSAAERIAVRFCIHMGVIGAAVNSQYASAWRVRPGLQPYDDLAFWVAEHLKVNQAPTVAS